MDDLRRRAGLPAPTQSISQLKGHLQRAFDLGAELPMRNAMNQKRYFAAIRSHLQLAAELLQQLETETPDAGSF